MKIKMWTFSLKVGLFFLRTIYLFIDGTGQHLLVHNLIHMWQNPIFWKKICSKIVLFRVQNNRKFFEHVHNLLVPTEHAKTLQVHTEHAHTQLLPTDHAHSLFFLIIIPDEILSFLAFEIKKMHFK